MLVYRALGVKVKFYLFTSVSKLGFVFEVKESRMFINTLVAIVLRVKAIDSLKKQNECKPVFFLPFLTFCYNLYGDCSWAVSQINIHVLTGNMAVTFKDDLLLTKVLVKGNFDPSVVMVQERSPGHLNENKLF